MQMHKQHHQPTVAFVTYPYHRVILIASVLCGQFVPAMFARLLSGVFLTSGFVEIRVRGVVEAIKQPTVGLVTYPRHVYIVNFIVLTAIITNPFRSTRPATLCASRTKSKIRANEGRFAFLHHRNMGRAATLFSVVVVFHMHYHAFPDNTGLLQTHMHNTATPESPEILQQHAGRRGRGNLETRF